MFGKKSLLLLDQYYILYANTNGGPYDKVSKKVTVFKPVRKSFVSFFSSLCCRITVLPIRFYCMCNDYSITLPLKKATFLKIANIM